MTVFLILAGVVLPTWGFIGWTIVRAGAVADRMLDEIQQTDPAPIKEELAQYIDARIRPSAQNVYRDSRTGLVNDELERERSKWQGAKFDADTHARPLPPIGLWPQKDDYMFDLSTLINRMDSNPVPDRTEVGRWRAFLTEMIDGYSDEKLMED